MSILYKYQNLILILSLICINIKLIYTISNSNYNNHILSENDINTYIIHLHDTHSHDDIEKDFKNYNIHQHVNIKHYHYHAIHGMTISLSDSAYHDHYNIIKKMNDFPGIKRIVKDTIKRLPESILKNKPVQQEEEKFSTRENVELPWGVDFLDGAAIDNSYKPDYTGKGIDVYVLDTGIDTNHNEFKHNTGDSVRIVDFPISN